MTKLVLFSNDSRPLRTRTPININFAFLFSGVTGTSLECYDTRGDSVIHCNRDILGAVNIRTDNGPYRSVDGSMVEAFLPYGVNSPGNDLCLFLMCEFRDVFGFNILFYIPRELETS